ncbi:unnamed protein product [Coccothraustes coccothraustes]
MRRSCCRARLHLRRPSQPGAQVRREHKGSAAARCRQRALPRRAPAAPEPLSRRRQPPAAFPCRYRAPAHLSPLRGRPPARKRATGPEPPLESLLALRLVPALRSAPQPEEVPRSCGELRDTLPHVPPTTDTSGARPPPLPRQTRLGSPLRAGGTDPGHAVAKVLGPGLVARDVVVDALPCFNQGYEAPGVRQGAVALGEEETQRYRPTKNYLSYLPVHDYSAFETELMRNESERLAAWQPLELLSMKRYELPAPSSGQKNDITAWQECVNNSTAQLEHQAVRIKNLELRFQHGCNTWMLYNEHLVHMIEQAQKELQKLRKTIQDLNWQRKSMQFTARAKL